MSLLEVTIGGAPPIRFPIGAGPVGVGSGADCEVRIEDSAVADLHVRLARVWQLQAVDESAATVVRGRRVVREWLEPGDVFTLGTNGRINVKLVPGVDGLIERPEDPTGRAMPDAPPATADEVEALRQRVRELEAERAQLKTHIEQLEAEAASSRTTASVDQARREQEDAANWIESLKLEEPLDSSELESLGVTGAHERMRVAFDVLFGFTKQLEQTTDRILRATGSSDSTGIFGRRSFAQRLGQALRAPDSDRSRRILEEQVQFLLRGWTTGTLRIYRDGVEDWAQGFLARIAPKAIQIRAGISDNKLNFGLGHRAIWETYKGFVLELTAAVLVEEIDESVQARIPELGDGR